MEPEATADAKDTPSLSYATAYFVLPRYIEEEPAKVLDLLGRGGPAGAAFFFTMACFMRGLKPDPAALAGLSVRSGELDAGRRYHLIRYPVPPPVRVSEDGFEDMEKMLASLENMVLAPYFSAVIEDRGRLSYYILGQSPDGGTTLRSVSGSVNANLGRGCAAEPEAFVALLRSRVPSAGSEKRWWQFWK